MSYKYRLKRRTQEVIKAIIQYADDKDRLLDLGCAEGEMLKQIKNLFPRTDCTGIEYNSELIGLNKDSRINLICGDIDEIPFGENSFNIIVATAVIEHVANPEAVLEKAYAALKFGGILIITSPDPKLESLATKMGMLPKGDHNKVMRINELEKLLINKRFTVINSYKFMFSPIGFPFENQIEKFIRLSKLDFLFANQIVVAEKK